MFTSSAITAAFLGALFSSFLVEPAFDLKAKNKMAGNLAFALLLIPPGICIMAGLDLMDSWSDPTADADPNTIGKLSARSRGRGGVIILAMKYWPYVLTGIGSLAGLNALMGLLRSPRS